MKKIATIVASALLLVTVTGCGAVPFSKFSDAVKACGSPAGIRVSDEGTTITIDGNGEYDYSGAEIYSIACVLEGIDTPSYVITNMDTTNSLMGRQTANFGDDIDISWSYHPDNGLDIVIHKN